MSPATKPEPVIVTGVPTDPDAGEKPVIDSTSGPAPDLRRRTATLAVERAAAAVGAIVAASDTITTPVVTHRRAENARMSASSTWDSMLRPAAACTRRGRELRRPGDRRPLRQTE